MTASRMFSGVEVPLSFMAQCTNVLGEYNWLFCHVSVEFLVIKVCNSKKKVQLVR